MSRIGIQAAVTMGQLQNKLDLIGNNLANTNTNGYKSRQANFSSLLFQQIDNLSDPANAEGRLTPDGLRVGSGARLGHTNADLSAGSLQETGRALDVALLDDDQLFQVQVTENGVSETRFTRAGSFYLNPLENGQIMLTNQDGNPIIGENGPLTFADGFEDIHITGNGIIEVTRNGQTAPEGRLAVVEAVRPRVLEPTGDNSFRLPDLDALNYQEGEIIQQVGENDLRVKTSSLESSNVDISKQMTDMLLTQRSYQFNARSISMSDQMAGLVNQLR
ncbi:flagellar hook-basal body protein [Sediminibacillus halophilus]|uniref:Flagellar basal-body rod protein FlgG n=1 Tax=Sediminibacillus halophilus TaxID=482461 RepID=A0A1G9U2Q2_9BACI|nr:flagellar hook-basal body protein [Sediminibacillus halophilus]SDM54171.1 flagellar basal-body rod protein FlgG [Sediminibacillus halophilus]